MALISMTTSMIMNPREIGSGPVLRTSNTNTEYDRETQDDEIKMGEYLNILKQMD